MMRQLRRTLHRWFPAIALLSILGLLAFHLSDRHHENDDIKRVYVAARNSTVLIEGFRADKEQSIGTGIIISKDGYILTCAHILRDSSKIYVTPFDGSRVISRRVAEYPNEDVLVLQAIFRDGKTQVAKFNPNIPEVGDRVLLISHPRDMRWTTSVAFVSAIRSTPTEDLIQSDATGTIGSSGGGLFDLDGKVVGIFQYKICENNITVPDSELNIFLSSKTLIKRGKIPYIK